MKKEWGDVRTLGAWNEKEVQEWNKVRKGAIGSGAKAQASLEEEEENSEEEWEQDLRAPKPATVTSTKEEPGRSNKCRPWVKARRASRDRGLHPSLFPSGRVKIPKRHRRQAGRSTLEYCIPRRQTERLRLQRDGRMPRCSTPSLRSSASREKSECQNHRPSLLCEVPTQLPAGRSRPLGEHLQLEMHPG